MTAPMLMMPAPIVRTRFGDWPFAVKSILGFWIFYSFTVVARAFLGTDPWTQLEDKLVVIAIGIVLTGLIYLAIATFGKGGGIRRKAIVAAAGSVAASLVMGVALILLEDSLPQSKEEFRYQAREGFTVIEKGNQVRIERTTQEPLVLTMPRVHDLDSNKRIRAALDASVVWLFFFIAWGAFYLANQAQAEALGAQRRLADAESAAQAAQVRALRYQVNPHFLFNTLNSLSSLVMTGRTDRAETMLLALSTFFRTSLSLDPSADVSLAEEIDLQRLYLDIEMARFPDRLTVEIDVPSDLEHAEGVTFADLRAEFGEAPAAREHIERFARYLGHLDAFGVGDWVHLDLSIVRGLAYYTGIVFELFDAKGELRAICGGGRYDTLLKALGGADLPALGFGMGDVVLGELLTERGLWPENVQDAVDFHMVAGNGAGQRPYADVLRLIAALRKAGFSVNHAMNADRYMSQATRNQVDGARKAGSSAIVYFREDGAVEVTSLLGKMTGAATHAVDADAVLSGDVQAMQDLRQWLTTRS